MKANLVKSFFIIIISQCTTIFYSSKIIVLALLGKLTRQLSNNCAVQWSKRLLWLAQVKTHIIHPQHLHYLPNRKYIIMSNHVSAYDIPIIFATIPGSIRMVAKQELRKIPIFGYAMLKSEFVFINRHNREQALKDLEKVKASMHSGIIPWIAPEGTRSRSNSLLPFKKGGFMLALQTNAIIIPVGIRNAEKVLPADSMRVQLGVDVEVHIGAHIDTNHYAVASRDKLMTDVANAISALADTPIYNKHHNK